MDAFEWLVIILAGVLTVLLVLVIYFVYQLTKVMSSLRKISSMAEGVASNVEAASRFFKNSAGKLAITKLITNIVETVKDSGGKKK